MARKKEPEVKPSKSVVVKKIPKTELGPVYDWKEEMERYGNRASATAEMTGGNKFSIRQGRLSFKGAEIQDSTMDVIMLDVGLENAYYKGAYDPDTPKPPVCFAL